jgi:hypothetical protein
MNHSKAAPPSTVRQRVEAEVVSESKNVGRSRLPSWAYTVFRDNVDHNENIYRVLNLSIRGIASLRGYHGTIKYFAEHEIEPNITAEQITEAKEEHDLAQQEVDHGFPLLHEQASVASWSSLESLVNSLVASLLTNCPDA